MEKVKELHAKIKEHFAEFDKNHEDHYPTGSGGIHPADE